jgi:hypothetical protein
VPPVEHAERAHVAFGHGDKQHLVARAAVHDLTVAVPGRKSFTLSRKISGHFPEPGQVAVVGGSAAAMLRSGSMRTQAM